MSSAILPRLRSLAPPHPPMLPRSLRGQFTLALWILMILSVAGSLAAVLALRTSSSAARQLAQDRLARMQQAQEIVQRTLLIDREADRLLTAPTLVETQASHAVVLRQAAALDRLVGGLADNGDNLALLDLQQANQVFRNAADVVVQLRESTLQADQALADSADEAARRPGRDGAGLAILLYRLEHAGSVAEVERLRSQSAPRGGPADASARDPFDDRLALIALRDELRRCHEQLAHQAELLVAAAHQQSSALDADYRAAVQTLVDQSRHDERRILLLSASGLLFAWLASAVFRRHVLQRLQHVSRYLLQDGPAARPLEALVRGGDEIGDMARAVDRFLADRAKLDARTAELQETQARLLAAARVAGMAEIATNILHNVGNVLNSINVSAELIDAQLRASRTKGLAKAVRLMDDHADDLGDFLQRDAKGRLLHSYLRDLGPVLEAEQDAMAGELAALVKSVEHVKNVVATQQSWAGARRSVESQDVADLVADALRMCAESLVRHRVNIVNNVGRLPGLPLDSNRMLQILVNLIGNAKQALDSVQDRDPCVTLAAHLDDTAGARRLRVTVSDNGEGISPENLGRIFSHGFTTRKNGHGFGLHSCVLAAQEMGGTLTARSEGVGHGAIFVLDVPVEAGEVSP